MAERKAVNKYYPPDWEPSHGSLNQYVKRKGIHVSTVTKPAIGTVLRDHKLPATPTPTTTKRIRFELPLPIWCSNCHRHIAKNVRFNADKRQTAMYHTTPILQFAFKCPSCPQEIVVESVPAETCYKVVSGATAKTEVADDVGGADADCGYEDNNDEQVSAFAKVEREVLRRERVEQERPKLEQLMNVNEQLWQNDFVASQLVRRQFREQKRRERRMKDSDPVGAALRRHGIERVDGDTDAKRDPKKRTKRQPFSDW